MPRAEKGCLKGSITFQKRRNFQVWSPPISTDLNFFCDFFFIFPKEFHFPFTKKKKKKKEAPQAPKKKMPRRRRRRERKKYIFFPIFFSIFFLKNNLTKFWKFWDFCGGGTMVSIGKASFSAKCLFGRIGGLKKF